ncbi:VOC family protein [Amycolatopsis ultiminotia]|uniref:VOC family protein n=1 Tax=Amycolatopsis ultiminotia TaxID=543629 RepID=A0ABP6VQ99_9PSEU
MARQLQIAIDCAEPDRLAGFWAAALGYVPEPPPAGHASWAEFSRAVGDRSEAWSALVDPDGFGPRLLFHRVPEPKVAKNRMHLDVLTGGPRGTPKEHRRALVAAEVARLTERGARHLQTVDDEADHFAVLQDPEGNEFCVC